MGNNIAEGLQQLAQAFTGIAEFSQKLNTRQQVGQLVQAFVGSSGLSDEEQSLFSQLDIQDPQVAGLVVSFLNAKKGGELRDLLLQSQIGLNQAKIVKTRQGPGKADGSATVGSPTILNDPSGKPIGTLITKKDKKTGALSQDFLPIPKVEGGIGGKAGTTKPESPSITGAIKGRIINAINPQPTNNPVSTPTPSPTGKPIRRFDLQGNPL